MPRSISQGPVKYDQKDELSRAGRKIAALKKHIRFLEEVLEERTRPSSYVRALSEGDDHDKASVGVHLDKITEWKENFGLLHKAYQDSVEESKQRAQEVRKLEEVVRKKDEKIAALERALSCKTKKTKHQKTELKNLQQSLTSAKAEIETHRQYANSVQECNAEKEQLLTQANEKLSKTNNRNAYLEMLILRCQEKEQEGLDKLDELNARLFEMEDERLSLENLLQDYTEIDRERSDRLQEIEMETRVWKEKCLHMENLLPEGIQGSLSPSEQRVPNDIASLMSSEDLPVRKEENLVGHVCPTIKFVPPCPEFLLLGTETIKALCNLLLRSENSSPLRDRNDPSSKDSNDSLKDYSLTPEPVLSADRKRARHKDYNPRQLLSLYRKRRLSITHYSPKLGMKRFCAYRRQWEHDRRILQEQIDVLKHIDNSFTQMCFNMKQLCEAFRPRVEEVVKWVVRHPYLSQYSRTAKCTLFMEILNIQTVEEFVCAEDVVARWCEGCGDCESSWDNLLLLLEESSNEDLQRVARFFRSRLAECLPGNRLAFYGGARCFACDQHFPKRISHPCD